MRSIALGFIAITALVAGCQISPYYAYGAYGDNRYSKTVYDEIPIVPIRFPMKLTFPDTTQFGFPLYDDAPRSDLNLRSISCHADEDGNLIVVATVRNMGADDVYRTTLGSGDIAAYHVAALFTTISGTTERLDGLDRVGLDIASEGTIAFASRTKAADVARIDVVVDPDRIVPDPIRDNNILSWRGSIDAANPKCEVQR